MVTGTLRRILRSHGAALACGTCLLAGLGGGWWAQAISFNAPVVYPAGSGPDSEVVGDFNGDGKRDLAVANHNSGTVSILLGNGDGTFQPG